MVRSGRCHVDHDGGVDDLAANDDQQVEDLPQPAPHVDGRSARRDRNREAVLDAALELFGEGRTIPSAALVAERSGVSLRSVYRYFEDRPALLQAAIRRHASRIGEILELPDPQGRPLEERIASIAASRTALEAAIGPIAEAARIHAATNDVVRESMEERRSLLRNQVAEQFAGEMAKRRGKERARLHAALDLVLSLEGITHLRRDPTLHDDDVESVVVLALRSLLS